MTGPKTNEREGTRAILRHSGTSPYKVRVVLDLIRNQPVGKALDILQFSERDAAQLVHKLLRSAIANAETNDGLDPEELFVSACYADEGPTAKRWRPRARGRAGRIRKRTCHVTVIVSRLPEQQLARLRAKQASEQSSRRGRRVAGSRDTGGGRPTRRGATPAASVAAAADAEDIVDVDAAGVAAADEAANETTAVETTAVETTAVETSTTDVGETDTGETDTGETGTGSETETEAESTGADGPVAVQVAEADAVDGVEATEAGGSAEAELAAQQAEDSEGDQGAVAPDADEEGK